MLLFYPILKLDYQLVAKSDFRMEKSLPRIA